MTLTQLTDEPDQEKRIARLSTLKGGDRAPQQDCGIHRAMLERGDGAG